jgi:SAM-dependent methyltransferase
MNQDEDSDSRLRETVSRLPPAAQRVVRHVGRRVRGGKAHGRLIRFGNLGRVTPIDPNWGLSRGTPVDRYFIEGFMHRHGDLITGRVLEVQNDGYARGYGIGVTHVEVVDIDASNPAATIVADLGVANSLPPAAFDCAVIVQTLQFVGDLDVAFANLWQSLAPGGVLIVTMPTVSKLEVSLAHVEAWRVTPHGMDILMRRNCPGADVRIEGFGNVLVSTSFLQGLAATDLSKDELEHFDPIYPTGVCALAIKR